MNELKKHLLIAKICDSDHLGECWGRIGFTNANRSKTYTVADLKTGKSLEALQFNSGVIIISRKSKARRGFPSG